NEKPRHVRDQRPAEPPGPQRGEVERQAESEETVERTDQAQIARAGIEHRRVRVEQREPRGREGRGTNADDLRDAGSDPGADPGGPQRAVSLARTDVRSHHGDERPPEPEYERDQQVLQARTGSVARDRSRTEAADESGRDRDREIRLDSDQGGDRAHSQDVAEERPAEADIRERKAHDAAPSTEIRSEEDAADGVVDDHRDGAAGDAEMGEWSPAEDQARRQRDQ